ncbi:FkbM family methyltransferase [Salegentibacter sp. 24]|uniref:FkbM family methyltransferase n=1 Tax=Salegentibacter sp. 24 TaxID=2183986 RepID=UPI001414E106|nr:FkbM family methyltransferase [Salegentibacter sp. 24]
MIEHETFWEGAFETFENDLGWLWIELCEISEIILDIGANTGIYTLAAKAVNPKTRIYAFEPSIHTYNKLCKNVRLNRFDIECEKDAISNHSAEKVFYDLPNSSDNASLSPEKMKNWNGYRGEILEYKVGATSISDYIKHKNIPKIDLVKIDIEMHEPEAIEGLGEYLYKYKPIIILEVLSDEIAEKLNKLFELNDYELFHLKKGKKAEKLEHFKMCKEYLDNWEWNFIIFHKKNKEKVKKHTSLYTNLISS